MNLKEQGACGISKEAHPSKADTAGPHTSVRQANRVSLGSGPVPFSNIRSPTQPRPILIMSGLTDAIGKSRSNMHCVRCPCVRVHRSWRAHASSNAFAVCSLCH